MSVPNWPSHRQSIERRVKQVTEAASKVYSQENRNGFIRGQDLSRQVMSTYWLKQDLNSMTKIK